MKPKSSPSPDARPLRQRAERMLREQQRVTQRPANEIDSRSLLHELQVHQIELEMQNEELHRAQVEAQEAADKYAGLFDFAPMGYFVLDSRNLIREVNLAGAALLGLDRQGVTGQPFERYVVPGSRVAFSVFCLEVRKDGARRSCETRLLKDGHGFRDVLVEATPAEDEPGQGQGCQLALNDITERKRAEAELRQLTGELDQRVAARTAELRVSSEELRAEIAERKRAEGRIQASLREKDVLLKEIHHRVKNNLQVISSLVGLQADALKEPALRGVIGDLRNRVHSIALVHEKLYQSENLAHVEFAAYAASLLNYLWHAHGNAAPSVRLILELHPVTLPVGIAVPCGLILNELATNALRHAFVGRTAGQVCVSLEREAPTNRVCLRVSDDGRGLPSDLDWRQTATLGLRLVQMLTQQISGAVEVRSGPGTEFRITFAAPSEP